MGGEHDDEGLALHLGAAGAVSFHAACSKSGENMEWNASFYKTATVVWLSVNG